MDSKSALARRACLHQSGIKAIHARDRIISLDFIRGIAVMGILLLNIVSFGLPAAAYFNPLAYGGAHGADLAAYLINFILFDGKMRTLFSMLFGASILLIADRAAAQGKSAWHAHYTRMAWLLLIGIAHFYLLWEGDILAFYALLGMLAFAARTLPISRLIVLAVMMVLLNGVMIAALPLQVMSLSGTPSDPAMAARHARDLASLNGTFGVPSALQIAKDLAGHLGSWREIIAYRLHAMPNGPLSQLWVFGPETLGFMLLGMAGLRSGMLTGEWSRARYLRCWLLSWALTLPLYIALAFWVVADGFSLLSVTSTFALSFPLRPIMSIGWICLLMLLLPHMGTLAKRVTAAGRMALSNYLLSSIICGGIFFGHGLSWFGSLSRWQLYPIVALTWAVMLLWSQPWLSRFRFGPAEWMWRSLSLLQIEPLRIRPS